MQIYLILMAQSIITNIFSTYFYRTYDCWQTNPALVELVSAFKNMRVGNEARNVADR